MPRKKPPELTFQQHSAKPTAYRKSLIHECVTGQRRISDADVPRAEARASRPAAIDDDRLGP